MKRDAVGGRVKRYATGNLLLLLLLPVSVFLWSYLRQIETQQRRDVGNMMETILTTTAAGLVMWADELKIDTKLTAHQQEVERAARAQLAAHSAGASLETPALHGLRRLLEPLAAEHGQIGFDIVAPDGTQIASRLDSLLGQRDLIEQDPETITSALAGNVVLGRPFRAYQAAAAPIKNGAGVPTMICAAPIRDSSSAVIAVLAIRLDPARDFTAVTQLGRVGQTGETYLFDRTGRLLTESRFDEHLRRIGLVAPNGQGLLNIEIRDPGGDLTQGYQTSTPRAEQPMTKMASTAISGRDGVDVEGYRDYRGVPVVGAWRWLDDLNVGITTEVERDEAYASINTVRSLSLSMLGLLFVVAVSVTGLLSLRARRLEAAVASENAAVEIRDELLAVVSHDLRNPLNAILLNASLIERTADSESGAERAKRLARSIESAAHRMARLIDDLLNRTRIETGQMHIERTCQEPESLIAKTLEVVLPLASVKHIEVERKVVPNLPPVSADPDRLFEVLSNLAGNAIKFTPSGGTITLGAALIDGEIEFSVSDTGPGIPDEDLPHIFDRYWSGKPGGGVGVGLGLYIAKQIVEGHGGRIWAESRAGQGSTFHFRLGVAQPYKNGVGHTAESEST